MTVKSRRVDAAEDDERTSPVGPARTDPPPAAPRADRVARPAEDDRAVSDLVGYILTVSILLLGVGVVSTVGIDQIERAQGTQNDRSVERAMLLLEGNLDEVQESRAEARSTTLSLNTGHVDVVAGSATSAVTVNVSGVGDTPTTYDMGSIAFRLDDAIITYEGGGVFKNTTRGNALARSSPSFVCSEDRAVVSIVTLQGSAAGQSLAGGTASVIARADASRVLFPRNRTGADSVEESTGVNVTIDSEYNEGWEGYLRSADQKWDPVDPTTDNKYRCEPTNSSTMPVYVRQSVINVSARR